METTKEERETALRNLDAVLDDDEVLVRAADLRAAYRDVDTLEEALRSVSFDCEVAFKDGGYDGVVPTIHDTARAVLAPKP